MAKLPPHARGLTPEKTAKARKFRREYTVSEQVMLKLLRGCGFKFRRQHAVGTCVLDFYCAAAQLCVEVDGPMHDSERDARRDEGLAKLGVKTIRVPNADLFESTTIEAVRWIKKIIAECESRSI